MGGNGCMVKGLGAVGGLASKLGHCGHGVRQRTLHTPGTRPLQHSTSEEKIRSAGRSQGAASKKINRERHPGNGSQVIEHGHREERRERGERAQLAFSMIHALSGLEEASPQEQPGPYSFSILFITRSTFSLTH